MNHRTKRPHDKSRTLQLIVVFTITLVNICTALAWNARWTQIQSWRAFFNSFVRRISKLTIWCCRVSSRFNVCRFCCCKDLSICVTSKALWEPFRIVRFEKKNHCVLSGKKSKSVFDFLTYSRETGFSFSNAKVGALHRPIAPSD